MIDLPTTTCSYCQNSNDYLLVPTMLGNAIKPPRFCALCRRSLATPQLQRQTCERCKGRGYGLLRFSDENFSPCPECGGIGKIIKRPSKPVARKSGFPYTSINSPRIPNPPGTRGFKKKVRISAAQVLLQDLAL